MLTKTTSVAGLALLAIACSTPDPRIADASIDEAARVGSNGDTLAARAGAPLFDGLGVHSHRVTTLVPAAQRYFDQGLMLSFGFNHAEAIRSFRAAQKLDPQCAMCFWGESLASGPNINVTSNGKAIMSDAERKTAYAALHKAIALKTGASQIERDYIDALTSRYDGNPATPREPLDLAYADAMRELANRYPDDDDAAALFAEALMNTMPWNYWADDGKPRARTREVIDALERTLARSPRHPLALHLYIHAVEASSNPGRAEPAANELADLVPGSGHLVHMPSHIYWRVGRYHDASEANVRAAAVDEAYIAKCNAQGFYPALYYPHNIHFLWAASSMEGRSEVSIEAAYKVAANVRIEQIEKFASIEVFKTIPLQALTQFGHWEEILRTPKPPAQLDYWTAIWHYARGVALTRAGSLADARAEQKALIPLLTTDKIHVLDGGDFPASALLAIANDLLLGEIATQEGRLEDAIVNFQSAVATQDTLPYTEPPFWYYPTRQSLGLAHLRAGRYADAEAVYRRDLEDYPRNGWSVFGLMQSLDAQNRTEEARAARDRFETIWMFADIELEASRF